MKYRNKPVIVEAHQWLGSLDVDKDPVWIVDAFNKGIIWWDSPINLCIKTSEKTVRIPYGFFIIQGAKGELCPCAPDVFEATYEEVLDEVKEA